MAPKPMIESSQPVFPKVLFCIPFSILDQNVILSQVGSKKANREISSDRSISYFPASALPSNVLELEGKGMRSSRAFVKFPFASSRMVSKNSLMLAPGEPGQKTPQHNSRRYHYEHYEQTGIFGDLCRGRGR